MIGLNLVGPETPTWNADFAALFERVGPGTPRVPGRLGLRRLAPPAKIADRRAIPLPEAPRPAPAAGERPLFARAARYDTARPDRVLGRRPAMARAAGPAESLQPTPSPRRAA